MSTKEPQGQKPHGQRDGEETASERIMAREKLAGWVDGLTVGWLSIWLVEVVNRSSRSRPASKQRWIVRFGTLQTELAKLAKLADWLAS